MFNEYYTPLHAFQTASLGLANGIKDAFNNARNNYKGSSSPSHYVSPIPVLVSAGKHQKNIMMDSQKNDRELYDRCYNTGAKIGDFIAKIIP